MRFSRMLCATAGLLTLGTFGAAAAKADTLSLTLQVPSYTFNVNYATLNHGNKSGGLRAGYFNAKLNGQLPVFQVYCVDIEGDETSSQTVNVNPVVVPLANPGGHYEPDVIGTYQDLAEASWLIDNYNAAAVADVTGIKGAALQTAIWEIIDGSSDFNVLTGQFRISDDHATPAAFITLVADANSYLSALQAALHLGGTNGLDSGVLYSAVGRTAHGQDVLGGFGSPGPHNSTTPEGASLLMFLPGLIPVAVGLRRRRKK